MLDDPISRASGPRPFRKSMFRRGPCLPRNIDLLLFFRNRNAWWSYITRLGTTALPQIDVSPRPGPAAKHRFAFIFILHIWFSYMKIIYENQIWVSWMKIIHEIMYYHTWKSYMIIYSPSHPPPPNPPRPPPPPPTTNNHQPPTTNHHHHQQQQQQTRKFLKYGAKPFSEKS